VAASAASSRDGIASRGDHVRSYIPAPAELETRFDNWVSYWSKDGIDLVTPEAKAKFDRIRQHIRAWRFSDPEEFKDGQWQRVPLHVNIETDPKKLPR